jgi:hypothetical protein
MGRDGSNVCSKVFQFSRKHFPNFENRAAEKDLSVVAVNDSDGQVLGVTVNEGNFNN